VGALGQGWEAMGRPWAAFPCPWGDGGGLDLNNSDGRDFNVFKANRGGSFHKGMQRGLECMLGR
jgi:hypothetical protein